MCTSKRLLALFIGSLSLSGCATAPQVLTLNYVILDVPGENSREHTFIDSFERGERTLSELDYSLSDPNTIYVETDRICNFTADFAPASVADPSPAPRMFSNGTPGQTGFNVNIVASHRNITTDNPPSCVALDELVLDIGSQSEAVELDVPTSRGNGRVGLVDGQAFETSEFFEARVHGFDPANQRSNGDFRFINRLTPTTVLLGEGSYALTP